MTPVGQLFQLPTSFSLGSRRDLRHALVAPVDERADGRDGAGVAAEAVKNLSGIYWPGRQMREGGWSKHDHTYLIHTFFR